MNARTAKLIILVLFIAGAFASARIFHLNGYLDEARLRAWIGGFGLWGPLAYIVIYSIAPAFMLPGLPLTVIGGMLFGAFFGVIYTAIGPLSEQRSRSSYRDIWEGDGLRGGGRRGGWRNWTRR